MSCEKNVPPGLVAGAMSLVVDTAVMGVAATVVGRKLQEVVLQGIVTTGACCCWTMRYCRWVVAGCR